MRVIGYLRPDIDVEHARLQLDRLNAAGASKIYREKPTSKNCDTPKLDMLLAEVQDGDTVVVTSLDRIAHSTKHLLEILESMNAAGVTFKAIDNGIDTSTSHGAVVRKLLGEIVAFERQVVKERQAAGIAKAKQAGRYKGRKPTARAKAVEVLELSEQGLTRQKIADQLGIGVASVYRILKKHSAPKKTHAKIEKETLVKLRPAERKPIRTGQLSLF